MKILVTGGAGFIGSAVVRYLINETEYSVINVDKLTYASSLSSIDSVSKNKRYFFEKVDICDYKRMQEVFSEHKPDSVMHLAAESHVDRSIDESADFIQTNIIGTYTLLEIALKYWNNLASHRKEKFRFLHVSTDEVYGDVLNKTASNEDSPYSPSSPYSASKASSDHLVKAWSRTYGLPTIISNCTNNFGPYQFPEKLIPLTILNAIEGKTIPVYGDGQQIRDWLYVEDHVQAILKVLHEGVIGETYNICSDERKKNIEVVQSICEILEELNIPKCNGLNNFSDLISYVKDRPGHDRCYNVDATKIKTNLNWSPDNMFYGGLKKTVEWYLSNKEWCKSTQKNNYERQRLGVIS